MCFNHKLNQLFYSTTIMISIVMVSALVISFQTERIWFKIITPFIFYLVIVQSYSVSVTPVLCGTTIYYYKLRFDQINDEIKSICLSNDNPDGLISFKNQIKLIQLIRKHNSLAKKVYQLNSEIRRTVGALYLISSLILNLSLHLIMDAKNSFEISLYGQYIVSVVLVGFGVSFLLSMQIKSAHESSKIMYQILARQKYLFRFQWHVSI